MHNTQVNAVDALQHIHTRRQCSDDEALVGSLTHRTALLTVKIAELY
jgi:hypothetical protein